MSPKLLPTEQFEDVRDRLIAAARTAFSQKGYKAATIREITKLAGANVGAINYHFGSKQDLYHAVLEATFSPLRERIRGALEGTVGPLERVERVVRAVLAHMAQYREMPPIMVREIASGRELAEPIRRNFGSLLPLLAATIGEGQAEGSIRSGDPVLLALSTIAQPVYFNVARPLITAISGIEPTDERVATHIVATVRAALEKRP